MHRIVAFFMQTKVLVLMSILLITALLVIRMRQVVLSNQAMPASAQNVVPTSPARPADVVFDINQSYECRHASQSAVLSNKQMLVEDKTATGSSYILFKGDCLHTWQQRRGANMNGQKTCGLGQYVNLLAMVSKTGKITMQTVVESLFNNELASSILPASQSALLSSGSSNGMRELVKSCKQSAAVSPARFELPPSLVFKEVKSKK